MEMMLVGKTDVLKDVMLLTSTRIQVTIIDSVKSLELILGQTLNLQKQVDAAAKKHFLPTQSSTQEGPLLSHGQSDSLDPCHGNIKAKLL